jgi:hypothetical protein
MAHISAANAAHDSSHWSPDYRASDGAACAPSDRAFSGVHSVPRRTTCKRRKDRECCRGLGNIERFHVSSVSFNRCATAVRVWIILKASLTKVICHTDPEDERFVI